MRQTEVRAAPRRDAAQRADELARELHGELEGLLSREVRRPYFHYQNLMHDPKASVGVSVSPSPLARNPEDKLVLGYFQIDAKGKATTPTINDDFPDLSEPDNIAGNSAFRRQVVLDLARALTPPAAPVAPIVVAEVALPKNPPPRPRSPVVLEPAQQTQVIQVDENVYLQNNSANQVYWQQLENNAEQGTTEQLKNLPQQQRVQPQRVPPAQTASLQEAAQQPPKPPPQQQPPKPPPPKPVQQRAVQPPEPPPAVTITISPLEWRTLSFAGGPVLVGVRHVQTPDGSFAQGFVVDRAALTTRLAAKAGDMVAELHAVDASERKGVDLTPGWQLSVAPNPRALAGAATSAATVARGFLIRFVAIGSIALLAAGFVLMLVLRAEQLARERSQFAAAAAHELRTPLAGLQLYGDMLADGLGDPGKVRDYARRMSEEASRLGRVVSNVLGFSQLERGNLAVDAQVGSLGEALRELSERAQPALDRAGAALELDVAPELRARFDRDALARIVGNLLDNAEKYARNAEDRTIH